ELRQREPIVALQLILELRNDLLFVERLQPRSRRGRRVFLRFFFCLGHGCCLFRAQAPPLRDGVTFSLRAWLFWLSWLWRGQLWPVRSGRRLRHTFYKIV